MWRRAVRVVRVIRVAPGHNITPELRSDDNIIYTKAYIAGNLWPPNRKCTEWLLDERKQIFTICINNVLVPWVS